MRAALLAGIAIVVLFPPPLEAATITGRIFTAEHEDSVARWTPLTLLYRDSDDQVHEIEGVTDSLGQYHFLDLSADTSIGYVLRLDAGGSELLSTPLRFEVGQDLLISNFLLPQPEHEHPGTGQPVEQSPVHTVLITLLLLLLFLGLFVLARRSGSSDDRARIPSSARQLARDIASLDLRREDGVVGEEEYRKVRTGLAERLRSLVERRQGG